MNTVVTTPHAAHRSHRTGAPRARRALRLGILTTVLAGVFATAPVDGASAIIAPVNEPGGAGAPYAVVVMANLDAGVYDPQPFCTGALIAPDLVLTAGHCAHDFESASLFVGAGSENLLEAVTYPVADHVVHPEYNPPNGPTLHPFANDIAILRLAVPVEDVATIRLAPVTDTPMRNAKSNLRVFGWGLGADGSESEWLGRAVQRDVTTTTPSPYAELDTTRQLLVRARRGSSPCVGDSGGPLVGNRPGKKVPFLVGLVSYGSEECDPRMPIVYTRIAGQRTWIERGIQALRGRATKTSLIYRSVDRSWNAPEGTRVLTGELTVSRERLRVTLTDADLGANRDPQLILRIPSNGLSIRDGVLRGAPTSACGTRHGMSRVDGVRSWWLETATTCLGLGTGGDDVLAELVRDGVVLDEIHFTRVRLP